MKQAIKLAIEGGYFWKGEMNEKQKEKVITILNEHWQEVVVDKDFWQALGKAMGWVKYTRADGCGADNPRIEDMPNQGWKESWEHHWHRFKAHLAEGKDADSFFKELLK
jgi:hypothetical protein